MDIELFLKEKVVEAVKSLYETDININMVRLDPTKKEFEGDYTLVCFPFAKLARKAPDLIAQELGKYLETNVSEISRHNVIRAFCNLSLGDAMWTNFLREVLKNDDYGKAPANGETVVVEYSSPNTNKPLHLGHIRNNLLGYSTAEILKKAGYEVKKVQIINDRGIHICKSMLAWQKFSGGLTPTLTHKKGDHFVGDYYVKFENEFQKEYKAWQQTEEATEKFEAWKQNEKMLTKANKALAKKLKKAEEKKAKDGTPYDSNDFSLDKYFFKTAYKNTYFNEQSVLGMEAKEMLKLWEEEDEDIRNLWLTMNNWVYGGFSSTYERMGVDFDKLYYESETYLEGKKMVEDNLAKGEMSIFFKKDDNSTWIDLSSSKLGEKTVLRKDGTSMYITQDLGTANLRFKDFDMQKMVYVVGDEQEYHFNVLFEILDRLGQPYAKNCHHLSYGMVNLTTGKMKSREGKVVDADDLMEEVYRDVKEESMSDEHQQSTIHEISKEEREKIWETVALGALKFYILKVEPRKTMIFDPKQSIALQGQTGPYIQNAYVRTQAVQRKFAKAEIELANYADYKLQNVEKDILGLIRAYPGIVQNAAATYNPAEIANYLYQLAKSYHQFWNSVTILDKKAPDAASFRLDMSKAVAATIKSAAKLLGMDMPNRM